MIVNDEVIKLTAMMFMFFVTTGSAASLYIWLSDWQIKIKSETLPKVIFSLIRVEAISFRENYIKLYVRNVGNVNVSIDSVYLVKDDIVLAKLIPTDATIKISPGEVKEIVVYLPYKVKGKITIKVVTSGGVASMCTVHVNTR